MAEQRKLTKNEKKRLRAKEKKTHINNDEQHAEISTEIKTKQEDNDDNINNLEIEYVSANPFDSIGINDQNIINQFQSVILKFNPKQESDDLLLINNKDESAQLKFDKDKQEAEEAEALAITTANKLSKKKKKLLSRLSVAGTLTLLYISKMYTTTYLYTHIHMIYRTQATSKSTRYSRST